jgi:pyroglutamyl-peptidase
VILFTGFEPFGMHAYNPSATVAEAAAAAAGACFRLLPVDFETAGLSGQASADYRAVIHVGLAAATAWVRVERFAHNLRMVADRPSHEDDPDEVVELDPGGPLALASTFPLDQLKRAMCVDWDVRHSRDAGTYVCNATYYWSLSHAPDSRVVFIHVPAWQPEQARQFGYSLGQYVVDCLDQNTQDAPTESMLTLSASEMS